MANRNFSAGLRTLGRKYPIAQLVAVIVTIFSALHSFWLSGQLADLREKCGDKNSGWSTSLLGRNKQNRDKIWLQIVVLSSPTTSQYLLRCVQSLVDELPTSNEILDGKVTVLVVSHEDASDGFDQVFSLHFRHFESKRGPNGILQAREEFKSHPSVSFLRGRSEADVGWPIGLPLASAKLIDTLRSHGLEVSALFQSA